MTFSQMAQLELMNADEAPTGPGWYVLHVKPRTEKKVMLYLARYGCFRYLPLVLIAAVIVLTGVLTYHAPDWIIFEDMG